MVRRIVVLGLLMLMIGTIHAQENETYVVRVGDSLREIAEEFDVNLTCLMDSNGIPNPSFITPGQELIIPAACPPFSGGEVQTVPSAEVELPPDEEDVTATTDDSDDMDNADDEEADANAATTETDDNDDADADDADTTDTDEDDVAGLGQGGGGTTPADLLDDDGYYIVQFGESLGRIAIRFNTTVTCLVQSNNIINPDLIYTGQRLFISETCEPDGQGGGIADDVTGSADVEASPTLDPSRVCRGDRNPGRTAPNGIYVVQAGDILDFIGCDFGLQTSCLAEVNDLEPPGNIEIGQSLIIDFSCPAWDGPPGPGDLDN